MTTKDVDTRAVFMKKLSGFRADLVQKDWTPVGVMRMGSGPATKYISISQMKANLAPLFSKNGLEFKVEMQKPEALPSCSGSMTQHWLVGVEVTISDVDHPEECETYLFYGEGADSLDKGIAKATTYALKTMLASVFMIADGIDPESDEPEVKSTFTPKTPEQKQVLKEQVTNKAVRPKDPFFDKKDPAPASEAVNPALTSTPTAEPAPEVVKEATPAPKTATEEPSELTPILVKAIAHIKKECDRKLETGEMTKETYSAIMDESNSIKTKADANRFVNKYRKC